MKVLSVLLLSTLLVSSAGAQVHRFNGHIDLGGAMTGGGDFANDGGYFARAGVNIPVGREVAFSLDLSGFDHALSNHCILTTGQHCSPDFPNMAGATAGMVVELTDPFANHPITAVLGGGPFRLSNTQIPANMSFGAEAGVEAVLYRPAHKALTAGLRVLYVSHTDFGAFWVAPITVGLRFW
ncbi:MAG TPA: hypothetical protein VN706_08740 [Gemmatimonadaceae bacterium]|nr:hypothetical protein [Gemmatimonadaceae bacterium]